MSAAATVAPLDATAIRAVCRVPLSYFKQLLDLFNFSEIICFGLILDHTIGQENSPWAEISTEQFTEAGLITREWLYSALQKLVDNGWIRERMSGRGRKEYTVCDRIWQESNVKGYRFRGRCAQCKAEDDYDSAYVAVPHAFFRKLGACLDHASYACLAVIIEYSLHWRGDRGVWSQAYQLEINDFERETGLERSSITKALGKLCDTQGWALVERIERKGRPALYRAIPERFAELENREPRTVEQPERKANTTPAGVSKNTNKNEKTSGIELVPPPFGFCRSCQSWVCLEVVKPVKTGKTRDESPPGEPRGAPKQRKRASYEEEMWDQIKEWWG